MYHKYLINLLALFFFCYCVPVFAFDDVKTHRDLTKAAIGTIKNPNLKLKESIVAFTGYSSGFDKVFRGIDRKNNDTKRSVLEWLQEGSTDEDALNRCRASSHFHNPLFMDWILAGMSDSTLTDFICGFDRKLSAITWATGYSASSRMGTYKEDRSEKYVFQIYGFPFPPLWGDVKQDMGWDHGRIYLYEALTATDPAVREEKFVKTFRAVGMVLHLLQDMGVPAHVRNDMDSHLFNALWPPNWMNPFEKYVVTDFSAINKTPEKPAFLGSVYLTDFWDKDVYLSLIHI